MNPVPIDPGAIFAAQARRYLAALPQFHSQAQGEWESFVHEAETDTKNFYPNVHKLAEAIAAEGVGLEELSTHLFQLGFDYAWQGLPPGNIRPAISGMARELLDPTNPKPLQKFSEQARHALDVQSTEKILAIVKTQVEAQMGETWKNTPPEKQEVAMQKCAILAERNEHERVALFRQRAASIAAVQQSENVPEEEREGNLVLFGYQAGTQAVKQEVNSAGPVVIVKL